MPADNPVTVLTPLQDLMEMIQLGPSMQKVIQTNLAEELGTLEYVGLSWTTLLKISNLPDANERLACIPWIVQAIANGWVNLIVAGDLIRFGGAGKTESPRVNNEPVITVQIRTH